jgi:hypothetical protein
MPFNEKLAEKIRKALAGQRKVQEKKMFRGLTFMVNGKMCVSVSGDEMMCRFDPGLQDIAAVKKGFRAMIMRGKVYRGFGYVNEEGISSKKDFDYWINLCLSFNKVAKSSKKK